MSPNAPLERIALEIQTLDRQQCIRELLSFDQIPLDFTAEALQAMSTESLRHLLMAAMVTVRKYHRHQPAA
jgi:hypothetical protein